MKDEVIIEYASRENITFHGELPTGMSRQEWIDLGQKGQEELLTDMVFELVELVPTVNGESI